MPPIVAGLTTILLRSGPLLPLYLWGFLFAVSLVMMTIYPVLIAPLFNKWAEPSAQAPLALPAPPGRPAGAAGSPRTCPGLCPRLAR
jgi:hypothetical protein